MRPSGLFFSERFELFEFETPPALELANECLAQYAEKLHKTPTSHKLKCFVISEIIVFVTNVLAYHTKIKSQHMVRTKVDEANVGRGSFTCEGIEASKYSKTFPFYFLTKFLLFVTN